MAHFDPKMEEFGGWVKETQASLRGFIRMLGVRADAVDDIAQETYIVALNRFSDFDRDKNFMAWIRGIARNIVRNEKRKEARRRRIMNEHLTDLLVEDEAGDSGVTTLEMVEMTTALNDCIGALSERNRAFLRQRYTDCENASELAARFNMTSVAVRQILMKIRMALQKCIESKMGEMAA